MAEKKIKNKLSQDFFLILFLKKRMMVQMGGSMEGTQ